MDNETVEFNLDRMTLQEMCQIEEIAGLDAMDRLTAGKVSGKALLAVAYVVKRRGNPEFTLEDAGAIELAELRGITSEADPSGKANGAGKTS